MICGRKIVKLAYLRIKKKKKKLVLVVIEAYQMIEELLTTKKAHGHVCNAISFAVNHVHF